MAETSGQPPAARGAAWRRRQRRLRSMLRHERQTVRMELAAALHHSWGGELWTHEGLRAEKTASAGPAEYFELSSDDGRPVGGSGRRPCWSRGYRGAQNLDVPVLQMGEQLPDVLQLFASFLTVVAEPVVEVPKIFLDRNRLRQPQMVEQLVHVPTVVSYSSLQQLTAEQIVDIPVPGGDGGGERGGLQSSLPRQNSAAVHVEQTVDIPVPGRAGGGERGGLQSSLPRQNSAAVHVEQIVDIPVPGRAGGGERGGLQGSTGQGSTASSSHVGAADDAGQGVFRTFPRMKKGAKRGPHSGSELGADFNPSTLSAHQMPPEQVVDVPVPRFMGGLLMIRRHASFLRAFTGVGRRLWRRPGLSLWQRSRWMRYWKMKRWKSRGSYLTSVLVANADTCLPATSALVGGTAHLHTMSLSFIQTHGSALRWWVVGPGSRGLASPDPFLGAFRGVPYHRTWKMWRWFSLCLLLGNRSWYASATDLALLLVQLLDKVAVCLLRP